MMRTFVVAAALLVAMASSAWAQTGVFPVKGTNLAAGEGDAIGALITAAYEAQIKETVMGPADTGPALTQAAAEKDAALQLNLTEYITVDAVRLSQRIALNAKLHNKHGTVVYQTQTTAYSLDDMQAVAERIAIALHRRTELEHTQSLDNVTQKEAARPTRTFTEKVIGVRTGVVFPIAIFGDSFSVDPMLLLQFDARLEGTVYFLEFGGGLMFPSNFDSGNGASLGGLVGHIGGSYYLTQTAISPYVGAGVSPRLMFGDFSGGGLALGLQAGVMFMRTSSARIYAEIRADQNVIPLSPDICEYDYDYDCTNASYDYLPTELTLAVGIGW